MMAVGPITELFPSIQISILNAKTFFFLIIFPFHIFILGRFKGGND